MKKITFVTGNDDKFLTARHVCDKYQIELVQQRADIVEIQSEDLLAVARDKAQKAFEVFDHPIIISDDSWEFPGLGGFPGAYMHSINEWFRPEDFLRLILPLEDRRAIWHNHLIYQDKNGQKIFAKSHTGRLLTEIRGDSKFANFTVISMPSDGELSIAESRALSKDRSAKEHAIVWHNFAKWLTSGQY